MDTQKLTSSTSSLTGGVQLVKERNRSSNKVKLCGYLKKKRNKVGGWRKMWFVLQDKLLLSYASKEEYDNKLVSFKDVLNLVPGTMVRPLGGFRFTIETTTHVMYTFHCDDRSAYREWITMLLDSLSATHASTKIFSATTSAPTSSAYSQLQRFRNTSVDNIPHALWSNAAQNSQRQRELSSSCDSMRQQVELMDCKSEYSYLERIANVKTSNGMKLGSRSLFAPALPLPTHGNGVGGSGGAAVRLPIARSTAKILERNGVNSSGPTKKYQQQQQQYQTRQQQQVNYCNRNTGTTVNGISGKSNKNNNNIGNSSCNDNVTPARLTTEANATHFRLHGESNWTDFTTLDNAPSCSSTGSTSSSNSASVASHKPLNNSVLKINSMFKQQSISSSSSDGGVTSRHPMVNKEFLLHPKPTKTNCDRQEFIPKYNYNNKTNNTSDHNNTLLADCYTINDVAQDADTNTSATHSSCTIECKAMVMVKDQIQRMNIKGRKEAMSSTSADAVARREQTRVVIKKRLEEESFTESVSMAKVQVAGETNGKSLGSNDESDEEKRQLDEGSAGQIAISRSSEPIYAVVDLAHKYAQRQQRNNVKSNLKSLYVNRCRSYESIIQGVEPSIEASSIRGGSIDRSASKVDIDDDLDGIYEDGDKFAANCGNDEMSSDEDDENIYEPVGFETYSNQKINTTTTQPNAFWRYITSLKINSLLQFTRMRRGNRVDYDTIHLPTPSPSPTPTSHRKKTMTLAKKQQSIAPATTTTSQFSSIKHKFGAHRKSMQVRVRKMCARNYEPTKPTTTTTFSNRQSTQLQINDDEAINGSGSGGGPASGGMSPVTKKSKYRWKSVKIRPKQFNGANGSCTTDDISNAKKPPQRFFGSLPHLRKARISLFSTANLQVTATDQNSNVSEMMDKKNDSEFK